MIQVPTKTILGMFTIIAFGSFNFRPVLAFKSSPLKTATQFYQENINFDNIKDQELISNENHPKHIVQRFSGSVNLDVQVDVLGIAQFIANSANANANREGFVRGLMESAYYGAGEEYNVLIFNLAVPYENKLTDVKFFGTTRYGSITYGIWIFRGGEFINQGDGGWINWAFKGNFGRDGKIVRFTSSSWSCILNGRRVGDVNIWWGDRSGDGAWACNQWQSTCKNNGGRCTAQARWIRRR